MTKIIESPENGKSENVETVIKFVNRTLKEPAFKVAEKYASLLEKQVEDITTQTRKRVVDKCVNLMSDISKEDFLRSLRKQMTQIIFDFQFLQDCFSLGLDETGTYYAAENVVLYNKFGKVKKKGLKIVFKGIEHLLKEQVYSEEELASVFYCTPASKASDKQKTELSTFIKGAMSLLPIISNNQR